MHSGVHLSCFSNFPWSYQPLRSSSAWRVFLEFVACIISFLSVENDLGHEQWFKHKHSVDHAQLLATPRNAQW